MNKFSFLYWVGGAVLIIGSYLYGQSISPLLPFVIILILGIDMVTTSIIDLKKRKKYEKKKKIYEIIGEFAFWIGVFVSFLSFYYDQKILYLGLAIIAMSLFEYLITQRTPHKRYRKHKSIFKALFGSLSYHKERSIKFKPVYKEVSLLPKIRIPKTKKVKTKHRKHHKAKFPSPLALLFVLIFGLLASLYLNRINPDPKLNTIIVVISSLILLLVLYGIIYHIKHLKHTPKKKEEKGESVKKKKETKEDIETRKKIASFKIKEVQGKEETELDQLKSFIDHVKKIKLSDAAKKFGVSLDIMEKWAEILEEHKLITIFYPTFGEPELRIYEEKENEEKL